MKPGWNQCLIGDLGKIVTGKTPSSSRPECFGNGFPFITPTDMHERRYAHTTERELSDEGASFRNRFSCRPQHCGLLYRVADGEGNHDITSFVHKPIN